MSTNNLCYDTCRILLIKIATKSKLLLSRLKIAQFIQIPFIVFRLAHLIFQGHTSHLDLVYS